MARAGTKPLLAYDLGHCLWLGVAFGLALWPDQRILIAFLMNLFLFKLVEAVSVF